MNYIRVCSDLHLEAFYGRKEETLALDFLPRDERDEQSTLVLAGDISSVPDQLVRFLAVCLQRFKDVIFVPGNHEYYRHNYDAWNLTLTDRLSLLNEGTENNLHFATGGVESTIISGVRFIFGTMWGDGGPTLEDQAKTGFYLNDFRLIKRGEGTGMRHFTVPDMRDIYRVSRGAIETMLLEQFAGPTVVVTHHLPSRRLVSARFWPGDGSDGANGGFVGQCDDLLAKTEIAPKLWIHGHTHDTVDTELWDTRIVCNPAAYRGEWHTKHNSYWTAIDGRVVAVPKFIDIKELT